MDAPRQRVPLPAPCSPCQAIAKALVDAAAQFGARIVAGDRTAVLCADHLPLVVGLTAPRQLASWLAAALDGPASPQHRDLGPFAACLLCMVERDARARTAEPANGVTCEAHGGSMESPDARQLRRDLERVASGAPLAVGDDLRILRTALVSYASVRGTAAFVPRLE